MSVIFCDGFDSYGATADLTQKWASADPAWAWFPDKGRKNRGGLVGGTGAADLITSPGGWDASKLVVGFYVQVFSKPGGNQRFLIFQPVTDVAAQPIYLELLPLSGALRFVLPDGSDIIGENDVCDGFFHWVEVRTGVGTGPVHRLYIDGVLQGEITNDVTGYGNIDHIQFSTIGAIIVVVDDVVVYDDVAPGPVISNFPLGPREITTLRPSGDFAVQFARSTGSNNYTLVNGAASNEDVGYVEDGTSGHQDLYHFEDLGIAPSAITTVVVNSRVRKSGAAGSSQFAEICKSGTAQVAAPPVAAPDNYTTFQHTFPTDPETSAAWNVSGFNAATFGIKVV